MNDYERKYFHLSLFKDASQRDLRMLINDIKVNCFKIDVLTEDVVRLKDKLEQIEIINNDTQLKIKECIEREFLF